MPLPWLDPAIVGFPDVETALKEPDGLLAAGGALSPDWLLHAYESGVFPWYEDGQPILWWSPDPRLVLFPEQLKISRSLRKLINNNPYHLTINRDFRAVVANCGELRESSPGTWITRDMEAAYAQLHELGLAHSVEVWDAEKLVGGLYGVAIGRVFFGESMFSKQPNTSKLALVGLVRQLEQWQFELIDCQISSEHLLSLGAEEISRRQFIEILAECAKREKSFKWPMDSQIHLEVV